MKTMLHLWVRVGQGEYENHGQDMDAAIDHIHSMYIASSDMQWHRCPRNPQAYAKKHRTYLLPSAGFISDHGTDVGMYWSDADGNSIIQPLTKAEQKEVESGLKQRESLIRVERKLLSSMWAVITSTPFEQRDKYWHFVHENVKRLLRE